MEKSKIQLQRAATREMVEAELCDDIAEEHLQSWEARWAKAMDAHCEGLPDEATPEDSHWKWRPIANHYRSDPKCSLFAIVRDGELQGMMINEVAEGVNGQPLIYVGWLATAPWNRPEVQTPPRYKGVGGAMVAAAVELSRRKGYGGRIALHSLSAAEPFYLKCGMEDKGFDSAKGMEYFEMSETAADKFCPKTTTP
ncbi:MAG: GNAT family N-acetyltransferase [Verrucomicrobia bacterium]|nr:GNAT family N-acetyltransferase [Verrucomicrobiota bacterium]